MTLAAIADMYGIGGRRDELVSLLVEAERDAVKLPGCIATRSPRRSPIAIVRARRRVAPWSRDGHHYGSPAFASVQFSLDGLLARPSEMTVYSVRGSTRPVASGPMDPRDAD